MKRFQLLTLLMILTTCLAFAQEKSDVQYLEPPKPNGAPLSAAVRVGNMLYLSGQIGIDPATGKLVTGGVEAETKQTMENIKAVLERNGSSVDKIIKVTVFLVDIKEWPLMNGVYKTYFSEHYPGRSAIAGSGLALGSRVEIECIALVK